MRPVSPGGPAIPAARHSPSAPAAIRPRSCLPLALARVVALVESGHPRQSSRVCLRLQEGDAQQALIVARIDAILVDAPRQRQLETKRPLADLGDVVDAAGVRRQPSPTLDDEGV